METYVIFENDDTTPCHQVGMVSRKEWFGPNHRFHSTNPDGSKNTVKVTFDAKTYDEARKRYERFLNEGR